MGGNLDHWHAMPGVLKNGDDLDILRKLDEMEETIRAYNIRMVVLDGQNSMLGVSDYATDGKARAIVTNKLHHYAQRLNIALIGIRNADDHDRPMGPQSMADMARCTMHAEKVESKTNDPKRYFKLVFDRISSTDPENYPPIHYSISSFATKEERFLRKIDWDDSCGALLCAAGITG